ncbi:MAG: DUF1918 domain-containing protein [Solirubrobacteraceae bacterium]
MAFEAGKRVVAESESTDRRPRLGVVEEVLRGDPSPRYRIRWDDGHESIYTPASGALRAGRGRERAKQATQRRRSSRAADEQASSLESLGDQKVRSNTEPEADVLTQYYREEDGHIHLLE